MPYRNLNVGDIGDDPRRDDLQSGFKKLDLMASELFTALGGYSIVVLTQAAYNALSSPDANTLYFIRG